MWRTRVTEQYGLHLPFIGAGMALIALPPLVSAVSNAGGLGVLGAALASPQGLRAMIREVKSKTSRRFGVDFVAHFWEGAHIDVCLEEQIPVVVFFWCSPGTLVPRLHAGGAKVWMQVGSVPEAREAVQAGADAVIVQGSEAGGHNRGVAATFSLVPSVVDAIGPVPVIAAGGIADGRGVAAALALGADAVWVGTRLVASREAYAHDEYKRRILAATAADTLRTTIFGPEWPGAQTRVLRNRVANEWAGREDEIPLPSDPPQLIGRTVVGGQEVPMPKFSVLLPTPDTTGDFEEMCLLSGESAGLVRDIRPAGEIVRDMMAGAERIILGRLLPMAAGGSPEPSRP